MVRIFVEDRELAVGSGATLTVELNNALFASPDIEGDISLPFTLPAEGNEIALGFAHMEQTGRVSRKPCRVVCDDGLNWSGELAVQKAGRETLTAALVINPYPDGFGKRMLTENQDAERVVAQSRETHDEEWRRFLEASVDNPDVKFAPFFNTEGYGSENDSWGFWAGRNRSRIVNALFHDTAGGLLDSDTPPFSKANNAVFNVSESDGDAEDAAESAHTETNQLAFCPQIRIAHIFKIWCSNAGYRFIDHLGSDLDNTFLQSQKSLDGTASQYDTGEAVIEGETAGLAVTVMDDAGWSWRHIIDAETGAETVTDGVIRPLATGWYVLTLTSVPCREELAETLSELSWKMQTLQHGEYVTNLWYETIRKHGFKVAVFCGEVELQSLDEATAAVLETLYAFDKDTGKETWNPVIRTNIHVTGEMIQQGVRIVTFCKKRTGNNSYRNAPIDTGLKVRLERLSADSLQQGFNIFRRRFRIPELLPEVTNSAFLKTMMETMGLCYFVSGKTKAVEIVPYARMENAKSLDLTAYELSRETEVQTPEETLRTFRLKPMVDEAYNKDLRLPDVGMALPDAYANHEHFALRAKTNTLMRATMVENPVTGWSEGWMEHSGNPDRLEVGSGEEENREPGVCVPHQRLFSTGRRNPDTDALTGENPQLMVADFTISSDLYNTTENPSEIILTQYRGFRRRGFATSTAHHEVCNEVMLPVWAGGFSLTAKGANSLGGKYVKPVLELLGHKVITYKLRLPASMMQPVEDLLRPSDLEPERQTRFIVIRNVKTVPKKITFQIDNGGDGTVLCQIEAVKVY